MRKIPIEKMFTVLFVILMIITLMTIAILLGHLVSCDTSSDTATIADSFVINEDEYYLVLKTNNDKQIMVRVYPSDEWESGWLEDWFSEAYPHGSKITIERDTKK